MPAIDFHIPTTGVNLVTNGDPFGTGWQLAGSEGPAPEITDGLLHFEPTETDLGAAYRIANETLAAGCVAIVIEIVSISTGMVQANIGNSLGAQHTTPGIFVEIVNTPANNQNVALIGHGDAIVRRFSVHGIQ